MLNGILTLFYFLLALLILVIVHEFGHFWVARRFGIKVLRFSFGFGPVLWSFKDKKDTQYVFSLIPLGGYVKLLDEREGPVPPEMLSKTMNRQPPWIRFLVVAAGPLFNWILAFILIWLCLVIGMPSITPRIKTIEPNSIIALANIEPHSQILAIDGRDVSSWHDVQYEMMAYLGTDKPVTWQLENLNTHRIYQAKINVNQWRLDGSEDFLKSLGIRPLVPNFPPIINEVQSNSPAARAGLMPDDKVMSIANHPVNSWIQLVDWVKQHPNQTVSMQIKRKNEDYTLQITIGAAESNGKLTGILGVVPQPVTMLGDWFRIHRLQPIAAAREAFMQTVNYTKMSFVFLGRLVTGKLSAHGMSGPIGIAIGAGESAKGGFVYYLSFLALISISLAVINVLPIPLLDGGHLFYDLIELCFRFKFSDYFKSIMNQLGFIFLVGLMGFTIVNDLARLMN